MLPSSNLYSTLCDGLWLPQSCLNWLQCTLLMLRTFQLPFTFSDRTLKTWEDCSKYGDDSVVLYWIQITYLFCDFIISFLSTDLPMRVEQVVNRQTGPTSPQRRWRGRCTIPTSACTTTTISGTTATDTWRLSSPGGLRTCLHSRETQRKERRKRLAIWNLKAPIGE